MLNQGRRHLPLHRLHPPPRHNHLSPRDRRPRNPKSHALQQIRHSSFECNIRDIRTLRVGCGACEVSESLHQNAGRDHSEDKMGLDQSAQQI